MRSELVRRVGRRQPCLSVQLSDQVIDEKKGRNAPSCWQARRGLGTLGLDISLSIAGAGDLAVAVLLVGLYAGNKLGAISVIAAYRSEKPIGAGN